MKLDPTEYAFKQLLAAKALYEFEVKRVANVLAYWQREVMHA